MLINLFGLKTHLMIFFVEESQFVRWTLSMDLWFRDFEFPTATYMMKAQK
ncbi:hypothetical protein QJS04_geneDACA000510 [Acorus gramineus]|uniref:Uncharacterized protein n=1 Tax=Acorus gramineus TaxID=55184 RepID=A0AAV9AQS3_ACOGR|nr:hypothetical protein QJS04_geneDACA000510 [Acorus gramineus]